MPFPSFLKGPVFSRKAMVRTAIYPQPNSPLLSLPAEIRLIIYGYVFEYDEQDTGRFSSEQLALLATCRVINFEAIHVALQRTNFHITCQPSKSFTFRGIFNLGTLLIYLRYVTVTMPLVKLNCGTNNPFLLTQMPLNRLNINLTDDVPYYHRLGADQESLKLRYNFVSALLYRTAPTSSVEDGTSRVAAFDHHTEVVCESVYHRLVRSLEVWSWNFRPTRAMLYDFMAHCRVHVLELRYMNSRTPPPNAARRHYWIWHALTHFQLVQERSSVFRVRGVRNAFGGIEGFLAEFDELEVDEDDEQLLGWLFYNHGNVDVLRFSEAKELGWRGAH